MQGQQHIISAVCLGLAFLGMSSTSHAQAAGPAAQARGSVSVSPILIDMVGSDRATITLRSDRAQAVFYQVSVLRWSQENGKDRYDRSEDLIASPPQFTLAAGSSQTIRMGFRQPKGSLHELAYRVMLTEVPSASDRPGNGGSIQFAMQYAIPVFVSGSAPELPKPLEWQMQQRDDTVYVRANNPSNQRIVLNGVGLSSATNPLDPHPQPAYSQNQRTTVLAHAWREWRIPVHPIDPHSAVTTKWRIVVKTADSVNWQTTSVGDTHDDAHVDVR